MNYASVFSQIKHFIALSKTLNY